MSPWFDWSLLHGVPTGRAQVAEWTFAEPKTERQRKKLQREAREKLKQLADPGVQDVRAMFYGRSPDR